MTDAPKPELGHSQIDDNSQKSGDSGANVRISLVGFDRPLLLATALALSVFSVGLSFEVWHLLDQDIYWKSRTEAFLELLSFQGIKVPSDLLPHKEK